MPHQILSQIAEGLSARTLVPYLGPDALTMDGPCPFPTSTRALVERLTQKVAVPGRIRNNLWAAAQWIESNKHRQTLNRLMEDLFRPAMETPELYRWLAGLGLPLIVDSWYDGVMAQALGEGSPQPWGQVLAMSRNGEWRDLWWRFYDADGKETAEPAPADWKTLLYKPHGALKPAGHVLISDSDYVEVLTEIDIQTPIPPVIRELRGSLGFVFLGCRFYDQMERTFARQIIKRAKGPCFAVLPGEITRNEERFLEEQAITRIDLSLSSAIALIRREMALIEMGL